MLTKIVHGAFVAIVAKDAQPLFKDERLSDEIRRMHIPVVLMVNRVDGKIGFPGGTLEDGETPLEAAIRELKEEIEFEFETGQLEYVGVTKYQDERIDLTTHLFVVFVDHIDLIDIAQGISGCDHYGSEINGHLELGIFNHRKGGYREFLKNNFPPTAKEQLETLVAKYDLLKEV